MIAEETRLLLGDEDATVTVHMLRVDGEWRVTVDDLAELTEREFQSLGRFVLEQFAEGRRQQWERETWPT